MEIEQMKKYKKTIAAAEALVSGPRDEDYNRGGVTLRDYWKVNGLLSPLQMVDMKLKRALSQISSWDMEKIGTPIPKDKVQVDKLTESMLDLINYAAFVVCEAETLWEEHK